MQYMQCSTQHGICGTDAHNNMLSSHRCSDRIRITIILLLYQSTSMHTRTPYDMLYISISIWYQQYGIYVVLVACSVGGITSPQQHNNNMMTCTDISTSLSLLYQQYGMQEIPTVSMLVVCSSDSMLTSPQHHNNNNMMTSSHEVGRGGITGYLVCVVHVLHTQPPVPLGRYVWWDGQTTWSDGRFDHVKMTSKSSILGCSEHGKNSDFRVLRTHTTSHTFRTHFMH